MSLLPSYPYDEFVRDFSAIYGRADEPGIREYAYATYRNSGVAMDRSVTLQMVCSFLNRNLDAIDVGKVAVTSESAGCMLSKHLMRAIHEMIVPLCLGQSGSFPEAADVVRLAQKYEHQTSA